MECKRDKRLKIGTRGSVVSADLRMAADQMSNLLQREPEAHTDRLSAVGKHLSMPQTLTPGAHIQWKDKAINLHR